MSLFHKNFVHADIFGTLIKPGDYLIRATKMGSNSPTLRFSKVLDEKNNNNCSKTVSVDAPYGKINPDKVIGWMQPAGSEASWVLDPSRVPDEIKEMLK